MGVSQYWQHRLDRSCGFWIEIHFRCEPHDRDSLAPVTSEPRQLAGGFPVSHGMETWPPTANGFDRPQLNVDLPTSMSGPTVLVGIRISRLSHRLSRRKRSAITSALRDGVALGNQPLANRGDVFTGVPVLRGCGSRIRGILRYHRFIVLLISEIIHGLCRWKVGLVWWARQGSNL